MVWLNLYLEETAIIIHLRNKGKKPMTQNSIEEITKAKQVKSK
jgi:hypothetical protein